MQRTGEALLKVAPVVYMWQFGWFETLELEGRGAIKTHVPHSQFGCDNLHRGETNMSGLTAWRFTCVFHIIWIYCVIGVKGRGGLGCFGVCEIKSIPMIYINGSKQLMIQNRQKRWASFINAANTDQLLKDFGPRAGCSRHLADIDIDYTGGAGWQFLAQKEKSTKWERL